MDAGISHPTLSSFPFMACAPIPGAVEWQCICGCKTTSMKTMNKHMKQHSRQLNIKIMQLTSLTAVFHQKKRVPHTGEETHISTMDVDDPMHPPEQGSQAGGLGTIPHEPTSLYDGDETDDGYDTDYGGDDNGGSGNGGIFVDSDSEDEFESDEEDVGGQRDMPRVLGSVPLAQ